MSPRYTKALEFAKNVHKDQKRRVSGLPYILHPISVAERIAQVSDDEEIIISGLLHDTIEDCEPYGSVTVELLTQLFGERVASLVSDVTEKDKSLSWEIRKQQALSHIIQMSTSALLLKSADQLDNLHDLADGLTSAGLTYFESFKRGPEQTVKNYIAVYQALSYSWQENPLLIEFCPKLKIISEFTGVSFNEILK